MPASAPCSSRVEELSITYTCASCADRPGPTSLDAAGVFDTERDRERVRVGDGDTDGVGELPNDGVTDGDSDVDGVAEGGGLCDDVSDVDGVLEAESEVDREGDRPCTTQFGLLTRQAVQELGPDPSHA